MLNIKDAGRYANHLTGLISEVQNLMHTRSNYTKSTERHLKQKAWPETEDEIIEQEIERIFTGQIQNMAYLAQSLMNEKLKLSLAMEMGKQNLTIDWSENDEKLTLDTAIEYNKSIRQFANAYLSRLTNLKPSNSKTTGRAYKINVEGNQVPYNYDIETTLELDFDASIVKGLYRDTLAKADKISILIDQAKLVEIVDFTPTYNLQDSLEDVIAIYKPEV
jgi:hypothetical protein